eukprot:1181514-Prorocentrum_minimum.AAC.1
MENARIDFEGARISILPAEKRKPKNASRGSILLAFPAWPRDVLGCERSERTTNPPTNSRDKTLIIGGRHLPGCATSRVCRRFSMTRLVASCLSLRVGSAGAHLNDGAPAGEQHAPHHIEVRLQVLVPHRLDHLYGDHAVEGGDGGQVAVVAEAEVDQVAQPRRLHPHLRLRQLLLADGYARHPAACNVDRSRYVTVRYVTARWRTLLWV